MAGPARPQQHFELEEDIRPLTASGSGISARRRHLGPTSTGAACFHFFRGKSVIILGLVAVGAVYMLGKGKGQSLRFESQLDEVEGKKKKKLTPGLPSVTSTPTYMPSYQPTEKGTDPPVPTYDPTKAGTLAPTPRPTWGDGAYVADPNPFIDKFNTTEWHEFLAGQWEQRYQNSILIREKFGVYCPGEPLVPMCPALNADQEIVEQNWNTLLAQGPTLPCMETGDKTASCGVDNPWLNKTIWPLIRGQFCAELNNERQQKFPMPEELLPYHELGYNRADPTQSVDAAPFDGGSSSQGLLWFDANKVKDHFLKFEAMLDHYYEGLSSKLLESAIKPGSDSSLYAPMLQQYADQIARALLRRKDNGESDDGIIIGILGDSVTSGTDNCYFDAWPEQLRRQMSPIFESMGVKIHIRNAAKNGGWLLAPQMLCANDMLGGSDRKDDIGLDFLFTVNPFVHAAAIDAEHFIRRAIFGPNPTLVSLTAQDGMDLDAFMNKYASAGLIITTEPDYYTLSELHFPIPGHTYWFPDPGRGFWGMQSDGFCRLTTRAGSSSVVKRNWHWGPLIHQSYADSMALLFSRAARLAIDRLAAGIQPTVPPKIDSYERILDETFYSDKAEQVYKKFLVSDMESNEYSNEGLAGVHCAVGTANQPGSTLLSDWLKPAAGSPFEAIMNARGGVSYVPDEEAGGAFYKVSSPISNKNEAVEKGDWVPNPTKFSEEAPRTAEQCTHVDGSTMINWVKPEGISWVVWKVPERSVSIGRLMICQQRGAAMPIKEDAFDTKNVRFHYAVSDASGNWKVVEDTQKNENKQAGDDCIVMVNDMDANDKAAAWNSGLWVAVEWTQDGIFDFDYLVAM